MSDELIAREHVRKWAAQNADLLFLGRVADAFINSMSASLAALLSQVRADERGRIRDHQRCADEIARGEQARLLQAKLEQARKWGGGQFKDAAALMGDRDELLAALRKIAYEPLAGGDPLATDRACLDDATNIARAALLASNPEGK